MVLKLVCRTIVNIINQETVSMSSDSFWANLGILGWKQGYINMDGIHYQSQSMCIAINLGEWAASHPVAHYTPTQGPGCCMRLLPM